jgi:hypothetical protein
MSYCLVALLIIVKKEGEILARRPNQGMYHVVMNERSYLTCGGWILF